MTPLSTLKLDVGEGATAFATRRSLAPGDDPSQPYSGFNICHYTGDTPEHIAECRRQLCALPELAGARLIVPRQTHSCHVAVVDAASPDGYDGYDTASPDSPDDTDALVTASPDVALCINTADCLPIAFHDPEARVVGVCHAGWRGIAADIIAPTVAAMTRLGASAGRIRVAIGPCICADCYEVSADFVPQFLAHFPENFRDGLVSADGRHVDLPEAARRRLMAAGILPANIAMPLACTRCSPAELFSARALGVASGRVATVVRLHKK